MLMKECSCQKKIDLDLLAPVLEKYQGVAGSLITVLQQTQNLYGYLPKEAIAAISKALHIKIAKIMGVITFYAQFRLEPVGKHLIMVCQGTACHVNDAEKISQALEEALQIKDGQTTEDGLITIENVACLGCCSMAPVMMVQSGAENEVFGSLTPKAAKAVVKSIQEREGGDCQ